ncbi:MAG: dephospho-CoA kinase [Nanoarchaeota archaeon]
MIIGITGSFGSGKTTVSDIFKKYGFAVINADKLYHGIYNKNKALRNKIKKEFGTLNRNKIKKIVFNDYRKLKKLNNITHPIIIKEIKKEIDKIKKYNKEARIIVDVPLLFEAKIQNMFDKIIVVKCDEKTQIKRLLKKKKYSKGEIEHIINSQMPLKEKAKKADFVVDNSRSPKDSEKQTNQILESMQKP